MQGWVALILALTTAGVFAGITYSFATDTGPYNHERATVVAGLVGVLLGALTTYLGGRR